MPTLLRFLKTGTPLFLVLGLASASLTFQGCGRGKGKIPGLDRISVQVLEGRLYASFVAKKLQWDVGITFPIPGLPDSSFAVAPDFASNGTLFQIQVPLASLARAAAPGVLPWLGLPDGRALPDVSYGVLPRWDFHVGALRISAYLSPEVFGIYIPLPLNLPVGTSLPFYLSFPVTDEKGNRLGKGYAVPPGPSGEAGVLLLLTVGGGK
ncbi:MAG: hypothetical protein JNL01_16345 [Bdellovibrionales bacterium]|nr:hypothetical protein [Bdellovibrionales bacterium]